MNGALEFMRQIIPNVDELWDPTIPPTVNIARMVAGEDPVPSKRLEEIREDYYKSLSKEGQSCQIEQARLQAHQKLEDVLHALCGPASHDLHDPIRALQKQVACVFRHGTLSAGGIFESLSVAAEFGVTTVQAPNNGVPIPWNSCKAAATLVAILACRPDRLHEALKFQSRRLGGLPSYETICHTPSASLQQTFRTAKTRARSTEAISSLVVVSLTDVHIFRLQEQGRSGNYTSFAHTFVVGVGPEGVIIWQGWGEHGYGLDQWICGGGARIRTWQEAGDFVDRFEKFVAYEGKWDAKRNKLYKQCFEVDINLICGASGPSRPIVPKVQSWVRLLTFDDMRLEDIYKFKYE